MRYASPDTLISLRTLNSVTKYPSIPTYHVMEKGRLVEEVAADFGGEEVIVTEKIDGTNARIVVLPSGIDIAGREGRWPGYLIGSRTEWLTAEYDLVENPALGICAALTTMIRIEAASMRRNDHIVVVYGEVYGGKTTKAAKQYTGKQKLGFRVFDFASIPVDDVLGLGPEDAAAWRDAGGQQFFPLEDWSPHFDCVPTLACSGGIPESLDDTAGWLEHVATKTLAALDEDGGGQAEGVVVRTSDRRKIAKLRFDDYRKARGKP